MSYREYFISQFKDSFINQPVFHGTWHVRGENNPAKLVENGHCYSICLEGFITCSAGFSGINSSSVKM